MIWKRQKDFLEMLDKKEELTKKILEREDGIIVTIGDENCDENNEGTARLLQPPIT